MFDVGCSFFNPALIIGQILLAGDLELIEKGELGTLNKPLNPWPLESLDPLLQLNWKRISVVNFKALKCYYLGVKR